ncbi:MAG: hypothetical protein Q4P29_02720, partial [Tissierellia bacterium]|nr:hypothetical protein [Tissierellia bacterium]
MECIKCEGKLTKLEVLGEEVLTFFKESEDKKVKFSINIGGKQSGDNIIHGTVSEAYYCED